MSVSLYRCCQVTAAVSHSTQFLCHPITVRSPQLTPPYPSTIARSYPCPQADETIQLVERVNTEWLRGRCGARQGIFPEAYVQITVPLPGEPESEPEPEQGDGALVLYDFAAQEATDLVLTVSDPAQTWLRHDRWGGYTA